MSSQSSERRRHDFYCLGGAAGWEVWGCHWCGRQTIPSILGFLWPEVLQHIMPKRFGCDWGGR